MNSLEITTKITDLIERLRDFKIYLYEFANFLKLQIGNKTRLISITSDYSYRDFRKISTGF